MGQIIDFHQRRVREPPVSSASPTRAAAWSLTEPGDVETMMAPVVELWRSVFATYAAFWFAPLGLEVRAIECRKEERESARASLRR